MGTSPAGPGQWSFSSSTFSSSSCRSASPRHSLPGSTSSGSPTSTRAPATTTPNLSGCRGSTRFSPSPSIDDRLAKGAVFSGLDKLNMAIVVQATLVARPSAVGSTPAQPFQALARVYGFNNGDDLRGLNGMRLSESVINYNFTEQLTQKNPVSLLYLNKVEFSNYFVTLSLNPQVNLSRSFSELYLTLVVATPAYTSYLLALRYVFFLLGLGLALIFLRNYYQAHQSIRCKEQTLTLTLAFSLLLFNDPFFALYVFKPNNASNFFSALFLSIFLANLFVFWTASLELMLHGDGQVSPWPRRCVGGLVFAATFGCYMAFQVVSDQVVVLPTILRNPVVVGFKWFAIVTYVLTGLYIFRLAVNACSKVLIWRNHLTLMLNTAFLLVTLLATGSLGLSMFSSGDLVLLVVINYNALIYAYMYLHSAAEQNPDQLYEINAEANQFYAGMEDDRDADIVVSVAEPAWAPSAAVQSSPQIQPGPSAPRSDIQQKERVPMFNSQSDQLFQFE